MKRAIAKKTIILYVLKLLYKGSTKEKPITIMQITHVLNSLEVACDRKTVSRDIKYLIDFGLPIQRVAGKHSGYYYDKERDNFFN